MGERQLRRGNGVARRRVHHHHAAFGCGLDVDVVDANARAPNHPQLRRCNDDLRGDFRIAADGNGMDILDQPEELLLWRAIGFHHFETRLVAKEFHAFRRDLVGHEDFHG